MNTRQLLMTFVPPCAAALAAMTTVAITGVAMAQSWTPTKNVELVAPNLPGGSNDKTARTIERILIASKALPVSLTVVNKAGGGGNN